MLRKCFASILVALASGQFALAAIAATPLQVIEYYHASLDHYFVTGSSADILALDNGTFKGWVRTGKSFMALDSATTATTPVCRFYLPPAVGDSHFYSASPAECDEVSRKFPGFVYESKSVMHVGLPNPASGECPADWVPVYRLWNNRADSNHRYTTDRNVRDQMLAKGYIAEGYGTNPVSMCAAPPYIKATSPQLTLTASQTIVAVPGVVQLSAAVSETSAAISQVYVYVGAALTAAKVLPPYTFSYNAANAANLTLVAVAIDANGVKGYSNPIYVTATTASVAPPTPTPAPTPTPTPPTATSPTAAILVSQTASDTFSFSSSAAPSTNATIVSYGWTFGDGTTATGPSATHRFTVSGTYIVELTVTDSTTAAAIVQKTVTAVVAPATPAPPAPPAPPVAASDRVQVSAQGTGTNWTEASRALHAAWTKGGGDWLDKNGIFNGPTPTISQKITASPMYIDISAIDGDLLLQGIQGWDSATIDGVPAEGFWTDATSNKAQPLPAKYGKPSMIRNPARGNMLALTTAYVGQTVRIDKVSGPAIPSLPMVNSGAAAPNIKSLTPTSEAAVAAATGGSGNIAQPWAYDTSVGNINGLPYLRFAVTPANQRAISWFVYHTPLQEVYGRYCLYLEEDIALGMTELGVKLPGISGTEVSWRMEHGAIAPNNPNVYAAVDYRYAADTGQGYGQITSFNQMFRAGRWYVIEQYAKNNTFTNGVANSDGQGKVWINGNLVWTGTGLKWNSKATSVFNFLHVNVYHGGLGFPTQNIHYRIAGIAVSTNYIGPPPELANYVPPGATTPPVASPAPPPVVAPPPVTTPPPVVAPPPTTSNPGTFPTWRQGLAVGTVATIPNTAKMNGTTGTSATINAWNGLAAGATTWYSALNGGHSDSAENKVISIDLAASVPAWTVVDSGSASPGAYDALYYPDGLPASRHTYYSAHFITSRNRVMTFGAAAVYGTGNGGGPVVDGFEMTSANWDPAGTWPSAPFVGGPAASVAKHPTTDDVYFAAKGKFAKWTASSATWSAMYPTGAGSWEYKPSMVDGTRNRWVNMNGPMLTCIDLVNGAVIKISITGALTGNTDDYSTLVHDLDNDRYVTIQAGILYAIDPVSGASIVLGTVPKPANGVNNRLAYFSQLGGIAYLPYFASDILFIPTR